MTVVIAGSSPLNYLTRIGSVDVLYRLYGTVVVPQQVISWLGYAKRSAIADIPILAVGADSTALTGQS